MQNVKGKDYLSAKCDFYLKNHAMLIAEIRNIIYYGNEIQNANCNNANEVYRVRAVD